MSDTRRCAYLVHPGSYHVDPEPPEYCDEDAIDGSDYCLAHAVMVGEVEE